MSTFDASAICPPRLAGILAVWRRNFLVWRKLALPSILGNLADPMIYMFGLGYGLGGLLPQVGGVSYIAFLAAGTICSSTMNAATFEALYSAFSRMHVQKTWEAIMNAPVSLDEIVGGEILWAATKSLLSGCAILVVAALLGLTHSFLALWLVPLVFLVGLAFSALGMIVTLLARSYDFFMYYFTLVVTPMMLVSGVFFPMSQLPPLVQTLSHLLPLSHGVELARPLMLGRVPEDILLHLFALILCALAGYLASLRLARKRLLD
ncbi:MAG: ABC transporter permease [Rhodocyclaceae bacterium]|nr:ABC transporter permease [Rhodocyclaceae bacterium]